MGTFTVLLDIGSHDGQRFREVEALVDTGATFTSAPRSLLEALGHRPIAQRPFELADGRVVQRDLGEVPIRIDDEVRTTTCIFGEEGSPALLGAVTLEQFLLAPDPVRQKLVPVTGLAMMAKHGRKYREALEKVDRGRAYEPREAVKLAKEAAFAKFDETVELHLRTGLDPRHAEQQLRGTVVLPHGLGKKVRVLVFTEGEATKLAEEAGADFVGSEDLVKRIEGGWMEFDVALATKDVMNKVSRLGRVLGPRGLMPNPRSGTVVEGEDIVKAVRDSKAGRVEFRLDRTALVHVPVGKVSLAEDQLLENMATLVEAIVKSRPSGAKGQYIRSATLTTTMGPGIKLDLQPTLSLSTS
jgi:large subunit ribosomal protein L1